jgi:hypothetical protein
MIFHLFCTQRALCVYNVYDLTVKIGTHYSLHKGALVQCRCQHLRFVWAIALNPVRHRTVSEFIRGLSHILGARPLAQAWRRPSPGQNFRRPYIVTVLHLT